MTITDDQSWLQQGDQWRLISVERTDAPHLKQPSDMKKNLYPADVDAHAEIKEAEEKAANGAQAPAARLWRELVLRLPRARPGISAA